MRKLRCVIRHGAHEPVRRRLPHRVEQATADVQEHAADVGSVEDVKLLVALG